MVMRSMRLMMVAVMLVGMLAMSTLSASAMVPDENENASCVGYTISFFAQVTHLGQEAIPFFKDAAAAAEIDNFGRSVRVAAKNKPDSGCPSAGQ